MQVAAKQPPAKPQTEPLESAYLFAMSPADTRVTLSHELFRADSGINDAEELKAAWFELPREQHVRYERLASHVCAIADLVPRGVGSMLLETYTKLALQALTADKPGSKIRIE